MGYPEFQYELKNANGIWMASNTAPTEDNIARFAFFATGDVDFYKIYSINKGQWVSYDKSNGSDNCKDFVKFAASQDAANAWKITQATRDGNAVYQIQPQNNDGSVSNRYMNWNAGVGNGGGYGYTYDDTKTVGLWRDNASSDGGSAWILSEVPLVSISEFANFKNGDIYTFVTARGWMGAADNNKVISTAYVSADAKRNDANFQWTVYKSENGKYYLYNIGKGQFMGVESNNNTAVSFAATPQGTKLTFKNSSSTDYPIMFSTDNNAVVNHSSNHAYGLISWTGGWNTLDDGGSNHKVEKVGILDEATVATIAQLVADFEAVAILTMPEAGKYYRIKAVAEWNNDAPYLGSKNLTTKNGHAEFVANADAYTIFHFDGTQLKNYATGKYLVSNNVDNGTFIGYNDNATSGASFAFCEASNNLIGAYNISYNNDSRWLYVNQNNYTDAGSSRNNTNGYCFNIEEVTELPVAQSGNTVYYSLEDAKRNVKAGETLTLFVDTDETIELPEGVILDKNGFTAPNVTVEQPLADYVVLPEGMNQNNYKSLFGTNTVTDGTNYYATMAKALEGIHKGTATTLYCKPGADLGTMTHGHVCRSLTIYGNGAKISGGEQDFELDTYKFCHSSSNTCEGITAEVNLTVKHLDGCGAWGQRTTGNTLNIVFEECKDMNRVYISGTTGINNITLTNCSFLGTVQKQCTLYSNANGQVNVTGTTFSGIYAPVNLNHKVAGTQVVNVENCTFTDCGTAEYDYAAPVRVLSSVEGAQSTLTVSNTTFTGTKANKLGQTADILLDYGVGTAEATVAGTAANVVVEKDDNVGAETTTSASDNSSFTNAKPVAEVNGTPYMTFEEALENALAEQTITLLSDVTLSDKLILPANVTLNGNGKQINGEIWAEGNLTFAGHTKVTSFNAGYNKPVITIGEGACLEMNGSGRMVIGHGATFNITGTIEDAKTADKATLVPSLKIAAGASITGNGVTFNVNNAYIVANANTTSKNSNANGTLDFNINNSIWDQTGVLAFYVPTSGKDPVVNFELKNSVLTTTSHLVFSVTKGEIVIDNSLVNQGVSRQIENRSTMTIKNGSVVNGAVATSSNAINPGTIIVENATYAVTGEFSGAAEGTGTLIIKKGATVSAGSITKANITVDAEGMTAADEINLTANLSELAGELSVINNDALEAKIVDGKIVLAEKPVAMIGEQGYATLNEAFAAATEGQTITLLADATPALASQRAITKAAVIDLGGKTMTLTEDDLYFGTTTFKNGTIVVDPSVNASTAVFWMFANQTLTFDNVKVVATGVTGTYLIGLDGDNSDLNLLNGSEILVENTTALDLDIICVNASTGNDIKVENSKVNVTNLDGRVFFRGNYTVKDSEVNLAGITKAGFRIEAGQTLSIEGTSKVNIEGEPRDGGIHLTDLSATYTKAETATVNATVNEVTPAAVIGAQKFATLQAAVNAVKNGETITLTSDVTENVILTEKVGLYYTLDGNGKTLKGSIVVTPLSDTNDNRRITIKNVKFVDETNAEVDFISSAVTNHYPRLTVEGCTFTGSGDATDVAIRLKTAYGAVIKDCTGTGLHSFLQNTSGWNLTIENVTVTDSKSAFALGTVQGVTVKGCNIDVPGYGIRLDAGYNNNAVIESNTVKAFIPVVVRKATVDSNITIKGENEFIASNTDGLWCAIGTSEYEANGQMPTAATAQVKVDLTDTGLDAAGIYGSYYDALTIHVGAAQNSRMVTRDIYVATMDKAVAEAKAINAGAVTYKVYGEVELTTGGSHGILDLGKNVVIEGADATAKLTIVGGGVPDIKGVTFKNIILADEGTYLPTANEFMYQNYIDCTFENVTFVDGIRLSGTSSIKDSKVEANTTNEYAIWLDAGEFTMTGTTVVGGADAYGLVKSDAVSKITITGNTFQYLGEANKEALNVKGAIVVAENNTFIDCVKGILPADKTNYADDSKTTVATDATIAGNNTVTVYYAAIGAQKFESLAAAFAAAQAGDEVVILKAGTYALTDISISGKNITVTGAVAGVEFANIGAYNMGGANVTFNNVTFTYAENSTYKGLQHSGNLVYNNCTFNGQVFLYGQSETFNNCTFNTTDSNNYNVWTYGAKVVAFNECTFNSAGKSVLIYAESASVTNDVTVSKCTFNASAAVDGKAAIEMDSSLTGGINLTIDGETTATGFAAGNVSGNSLWNNKKGNSTDANNDITVTVGGETVLAPVTFVAQVGNVKFASLADAFAAVGDGAGQTVELIADVDLAGAEWTPVSFNGVFDGQDHTISNLVVNGGSNSNQGFFAQTNNGEIKNVTFHNAKVTGRLNVGVVAGTPYTSKYTNVKVTGHVEVNGMAYVGGVGGKNAYANWTDITVDVDADSYVKANSVENGNAYRTYVGGVIGFNGEGAHTFKNISSNIKVIGSTQDVGGIFGIAHYGNSFENITFTGSVEAPADAEEVGGIAGVWHNQQGHTVTFTGVTSTGTVTVGDVTTTGSIVGGAYNADNKYEENSGSLIIDGKEAWLPRKVTTKAELDAAIAAAEEGDIIVMAADIDYGTTQLAITKAITLDLGGYTLTTANAYGGMSIKNNPTIKNGTIVHKSNTAAIKVWNATAFEDLVIDVQGKGDAGKTIGGIVLQSGSTTRVGSIKNVTIKGAALTNGIETYNCGDATENVIGSMENVTIEAQGTGLLISAPCGTATNCSISGGVAGIELWIKGNYSATLGLENCQVEGGEKPVYIHDEFSSNPDIQNNGTLKLDADDATNFTSESGALAAVNIARAENADRTVVDKLIEDAVVIVGDVYFADFAKAWATVENGDVVTLLADVEASEVIMIEKDVTINGNGHKVTSSATRVFRVTVKDTKVTLNNVNMVSNTAVNYPNDVRGISIDDVTGVVLTLNSCSVDFTHESAHDWSYAVNVVGGSGHQVFVNGGTYEGANVINIRGTEQTVSVKGATLTSLYKENSNPSNYGACIYVVQNAETSVVAEGNTFNGSNAMAINAGNTPVTASNNTDNTKLFITGEGTEANPYLIKHASQLVDFRNSVNAGETKYNAPGVWVALGADIDLANAEWTEGIGDGHNWSFDGNFDGKNHTIKNLNIKPYADDSKYLCGGLFGYIYGGVTIKNLVIENATITADAEGHNVGVLVGFANNNGGKANISGITVKGDVKVDAPNAYGVGAIVGYSYREMGTISNCTVEANDGSYIKGQRFVGGITGYSFDNAVITECTVKNLAISGAHGVAGIAGLAKNGNKITNCTVENVTVDAENNVAYIVGEIQGEGGDVTIADNNALQPWVGGSWGSGESLVATIGTQYYTTIAKAIEAAQAGDVITLISDVTLTDLVKVEKEVTIDLGGKTVTANCKKAFEVYANATVKNGTIIGQNRCVDTRKAVELTLENVKLVADNYTSAYGNPQPLTIGGSDNGTKLTMTNSTISAKDGYGIITFVKTEAAISNSTISGYSALYVKPGSDESTFTFVDTDLAGSTASNDVEGNSFSAVAVRANNVTITADAESTITSEGNYSHALSFGGKFAGEQTTTGNNTTILGSINGNILANACADANTIVVKGEYAEAVNAQGYATVAAGEGLVAVKKAVAKVGEAPYATLAEAIKAAKAGDVVTVFEGTYEMPSMKAGITIVGEGNVMFEGTLKGTLENLTMKNIHIKGGNAQRWAYAKGNLVFENVTFEATGVYALHFDGITEGATLTYKDCTIIGWAAMSGSPASCTFDGCTFKGNGTYGLIRTYFDATIENCTFDVANVNTTDIYQDGIHAVGGATVTVDNCTNLNGDMKDVVNVNATSVVVLDGVEIKNVAKIGDNNYWTLQDAIDAATEGQTVTVLTDIALAETATVPADKTITLDLNGKTISQEKACTGNYNMILNKGNLTITGEGKISFKDTGAGDPNFGWGSYTVRNEGTLVVENGTIEHLGEQNPGNGQPNKHMYCAIFQYSGKSTINGGTISTPTYRSARLWKGEMTINGGTFDGQLWVQAVDNSANLVINGGTFAPRGNDGSSVYVENSSKTVAFAVTGGTFETKIGVANAEALAGAITGGTFSATAKENTAAALIATGYVFGEADANGYYTIADDPATHYINNVEEFVAFRDAVNGGNDFAGVAVYLTADIDLTGIDWSVNIGDDAGATFDGTFDGQGHTIKNLTSTETAQKGDGYICTGLFGAIHGGAVLKDFTIENVTINTGDFTGNNVAAVVGFAWQATGSIENVHVTGNININAKNVTGVGAILGYDYYSPALTVKNCSVIGNDGSAILGKSYVGGLVGYASSKIAMNSNTIENVSVTATGSVGAIAGIMLSGSSAADNTVKNVALTATGELWKNSAAVVAGTITNGGVTVTNTTVENVTANGAVAALVGGQLVEKPTAPIAKVEAKIGDKYYTTLDAALATQGEATVELLVPVTVATGESRVINLNGKTVIGTDNATGSFALININPEAELTINGEGAIKLTATNNRGWNAYSSVISNQRGKLTVNGGTIEHLGGTDMAYAIDNLTNTGAQNAETVINGGTIKSTYRAIRQFLNSTSAQNVLTVNGGTIEGANKSIWMQGANTNANPGALTIEAAAAIKGDVYLTTAAGTAEYPVVVAVAADALKDGAQVLTSNVPGYYVVANVGGVWQNVDPVAAINGKGYATLAAAIKAAKAGETITLLQDVKENVTINKNLTIDGADKTITGMITTDGKSLKVTIKNVKFDGNNKTVNYAMRADDDLNLVVENCSVKDYLYGFLYANKSNDKIVVKNVTVENCAEYGAYLVSFNNATFEDFVVKGSTKYGIAVANAGARNVTLKNVSFENAETPLSINEIGTGKVTFTFEGVNDMGKAEFYTSKYVVVVAEAQVGTKVCGSLQDAIAAAETGETVKLLNDFVMNTAAVTSQVDGYAVLVNVKDKAITIDLNGKKVTVNASAAELAGAKGSMLMAVFHADPNSELILTDSSDDATGTVELIANDAKVYSFIVSENSGDKTQSGKIVVNGGNYIADKLFDSMIYADTDEVITVNGGNFHLDNTGISTNGKPWIFNTLGANQIQVLVNGGTYNTNIGEQYYRDEFKLGNVLTIRYNEDGTWSVVTGVTLVDGEFTEYTNDKTQEVEYISYTRTMSTDWNAFYVPFEVPVSLLAKQGFEVAYINGVRRSDYDENGVLDDKLNMELIMIHGGKGNADGTSKVLKANYPYFIRAKEVEKVLTIEFTDVTLYAAEDVTYDCSTFSQLFEITGNASQVYINSSENAIVYGVSKTGKWTKITKGSNLKPFRFFMTVTNRDGSAPTIEEAPEMMSIAVRGEELEDGTTIIYDIEMDAQQNVDYIYDLQGRRVLEPEKGNLYIINGKKVIF